MKKTLHLRQYRKYSETQNGINTRMAGKLDSPNEGAVRQRQPQVQANADTDKSPLEQQMPHTSTLLPTRADLLHCGPCMDEKKSAYAVAFCHDCDTYVCTGCLELHRKLPTTRSHAMVPSGSCMEQPSEQYLAHAHERILQDLADLKVKFQRTRAEKQRNVADINKQSYDACKQVKQIRRNINKLLDKLEKDTIGDIRSAAQVKVAGINRTISETHASIKDIQTQVGTLTATVDDKDGYFHLCQQAVLTVNEQTAKHKEMSGIHRVSLSFTKYTKLEELLENMKRLGEVKLEIAYSTESIQAEELETFETRVGEEKASKGYWISGLAVLPSGCVLAVDKRNSKIKLFSRSHVYVDSLRLDDPCDVAAISDFQAVFTMPYRQRIYFLQLMDGNIMCDEQTSIIRTRGQCYGIAYCDEHLVVVIRDTNTSRVDVMDLNGIVTSSIVQDKLGNMLMKEPQYIAVDHWTKTVYVSDQSKNCLVVATMAGNHVTTVDVGPHFPLGLDVDSNGNVYFCYSNGQVRIMAKDGSNMRPLLMKQKDFRNPQAICYDGSRHCILVTLAGDTRIHVYDLASRIWSDKT